MIHPSRHRGRFIPYTLLGLGCTCGITGCTQNHLIYIHEATVGIHVNIAADQSTKMVFGYDSETFALVPERDGTDLDGSKEAMTLVSAAKVDATGLNEIIFNHVVATGKAARAAVVDEESLRFFRMAVFPEEQNDSNP